MDVISFWPALVAVCLGSAPVQGSAWVQAYAPHPPACAHISWLRHSGSPGAASTRQDEPQDMVLDPAQPEFTVVNLPTTLRVPDGKFAFRVTHRFARDLSEGSVGSLAEDFFGFDAGGQIGLELRYGIMSGWQAGLYRTSDRTIQLFTQYSVLRRTAGRLSLDALAVLEGTNNLRGTDPATPSGEGGRSPALGGVVSRVFGRVGALNATVAWVNNTNPLPSALVDHNDTVVLGVGGRVRIRPTLYVVGEITPRLGGYAPGAPLGSVAIEKRVGGHAFQINVSNGIGSTLAQVARGAASADEWYIGFNINRKFF